MEGGTANLEQLEKAFNLGDDLKGVLEEYSSLFWIGKITENDWEVRVKLDVELCSLYPQGICDGSCTSLHICKSFLLSGKFCKEPCKSGFSHDIRDSHNKTVLDGYNMDDYGMKLLRSSFPRLCASFQGNGKCGKYFCGYLHLCIFFIQGKCQDKCQFAARVGLSKQAVHWLTSPHNVKVFSSFDLFQRKRDILLANILFHSGFEDYCESEVILQRSNIKFKGASNLESTLKNINIRMCSAYLNSTCREGSGCSRLHFCKEFLIDPNRCPGETCKFGFTHDLFDKNCNTVVSKYKLVGDKTEIVTNISKCFPRVCRANEISFCGKQDCKKLHICRYFLFDACEIKRCKLSHNFFDKHNFKVFKYFNMSNLVTEKKDIIVSNILVPKVYNRRKMVEESTDGKLHENFNTTEADSSSVHTSGSFEGENGVSLNAATQNVLTLCSFYLEGKCANGNNCEKLHFCKEFLIDSTRCPNGICQYGFSHEPFDENNAKLVKSKWRETGATKIISLLRGSFPRLCAKYEAGDCVNKNCRKLHICGDSLFHICKSNYCSLSHNITDEHNRNVFKRYNLDDLFKLDMTFVLPNILVPKRLVNAAETGRGAYTNLRKSSQSAVRKTQSKLNVSLSEAEGMFYSGTSLFLCVVLVLCNFQEIFFLAMHFNQM